MNICDPHHDVLTLFLTCTSSDEVDWLPPNLSSWFASLEAHNQKLRHISHGLSPSDRIKEFRKVRRLLQQKHLLNPVVGYLFCDCSKLVTFYEMAMCLFTWLPRMLQARIVFRTSFESFTLSFGRLRQKIAPKSVPHVQHDYFSSFNQSYHWFRVLPLPSSFLKLCVPNWEWNSRQIMANERRCGYHCNCKVRKIQLMGCIPLQIEMFMAFSYGLLLIPEAHK